MKKFQRASIFLAGVSFILGACSQNETNQASTQSSKTTPPVSTAPACSPGKLKVNDACVETRTDTVAFGSTTYDHPCDEDLGQSHTVIFSREATISGKPQANPTFEINAEWTLSTDPTAHVSKLYKPTIRPLGNGTSCQPGASSSCAVNVSFKIEIPAKAELLQLTLEYPRRITFKDLKTSEPDLKSPYYCTAREVTITPAVQSEGDTSTVSFAIPSLCNPQLGQNLGYGWLRPDIPFAPMIQNNSNRPVTVLGIGYAFGSNNPSLVISPEDGFTLPPNEDLFFRASDVFMNPRTSFSEQAIALAIVNGLKMPRSQAAANNTDSPYLDLTRIDVVVPKDQAGVLTIHPFKAECPVLNWPR